MDSFFLETAYEKHKKSNTDKLFRFYQLSMKIHSTISSKTNATIIIYL